MKDIVLKCRISEQLKSDFFNKCEELNLNPSKVIRSLIRDFIKNSSKK